MYIGLLPDDGLVLQHLQDNLKAITALILTRRLPIPTWYIRSLSKERPMKLTSVKTFIYPGLTPANNSRSYGSVTICTSKPVSPNHLSQSARANKPSMCRSCSTQTRSAPSRSM